MLSGDEAAMERLYKNFYPSLLLYGTKVLRDGSLAEDCIHDLFLKLWSKRNTLNNVLSVKAYLFKAYRHILINKINLTRRQSQRNLDIEAEDQTISIQDIIIENEFTEGRIDLVNNQINQLPSRQKEILYLRFYKSLSIEEIADVLEINNQSVRNSLFKSLSALRKVFLVSVAHILSCLS